MKKAAAMAAFLLFPIFILSSDFYNYLYAAVNSLAEFLTVSRTSYDCSVVNGYSIFRTDSVSELRSL